MHTPTQAPTITATSNGLTQVDDGERICIYLINYRPEITALIALVHERSQVNRQLRDLFYDTAREYAWDDDPDAARLTRRYNGLTNRIKVEAKRVGIPAHLPYSH